MKSQKSEKLFYTWGIQAGDGPPLLSNPLSKRNFRAKFRPFSCKVIRSNWFNWRTKLRGGAVPGAPRPLIPAAPLKKNILLKKTHINQPTYSLYISFTYLGLGGTITGLTDGNCPKAAGKPYGLFAIGINGIGLGSTLKA